MKSKVFIFLIIILLVVLGIAYWTYHRQTFSKEILKLEIWGPESCKAGEEVEYTVKYKNNGNVRLEELKFVFEYPDGSLLPSDKQKRISKDLPDLYPGQEEILRFKARLFGRERDIKTAKASLNYRPKNLKALYESQSTFSTEIKDVSLTFTFDFPSKIVSGKETTIALNYFSNLDFPLSDLRVKIQYPSGFEFISSKPEGIERNEWQINMLNKAEGGRIDINGVISGNVGGQEVFSAELGIWIEDAFLVLKETSRGIEIIRPHLVISQRINGSSDYIASPGEMLRYQIFFRNIGEESLEDLFMVARLSGLFDLDSINSEFGRVVSSDKSIIWDWRDVPELQYLAPGEEGQVEFWINVKSTWSISSPFDKDFVLKNEVSLSQAKEEFATKVNSKLEIGQAGYFKDTAQFFLGEPRPGGQEVFGNSGPIPPKVDEKTTYTIIWQVKNFSNNADNVKVKAVLSPGVKLTGKIFPEKEKDNFAFNSESGEILWNIGSLGPGTGVLSSPKSLAFQIALTPSENLKGLVATLINEARVSGEDQFTEVILNASSAAVDTTLPDDSTVSPEQGVVE